MCSELTPRAPILDGRMAQFMQPWQIGDGDRACPQPVERGRVFGKHAKQNSRCGNSPGHKVWLSKKYFITANFYFSSIVYQAQLLSAGGSCYSRGDFFLPPPKSIFYRRLLLFINVYLAQLLSTRGGCYLRGGGRVLVIGRWVSPRVPAATSVVMMRISDDDEDDDDDDEYPPGSLPQLLQMDGDRGDEDQCELCGWSVFVFVDHLSFFKISTSNSMLDMVGPLQVIRGRCAFIWMGNVHPMYLQEEEVKTYFC